VKIIIIIIYYTPEYNMCYHYDFVPNIIIIIINMSCARAFSAVSCIDKIILYIVVDRKHGNII